MMGLAVGWILGCNVDNEDGPREDSDGGSKDGDEDGKIVLVTDIGLYDGVDKGTKDDLALGLSVGRFEGNDDGDDGDVALGITVGRVDDDLKEGEIDGPNDGFELGDEVGKLPGIDDG